MLTRFTNAFSQPKGPAEPSVPEVVPIEELTGEDIEAAEAEIEAEERWTETA